LGNTGSATVAGGETMTAKTKIGLPENRKRLQSAGVERARNIMFDEGYDAGFKAGIEYGKKIANEKNKS
jgi:hypothetical protein